MNSFLNIRVQRCTKMQALPNVEMSYIPITNVLICYSSSNSIKDFAFCMAEPPDTDIETVVPTVYVSKKELLYESIFANKEKKMRFINWRLRFSRRLKKFVI